MAQKSKKRRPRRSLLIPSILAVSIGVPLLGFIWTSWLDDNASDGTPRLVGWVPLATGRVCILERWHEFRVLQRWRGPERSRIETSEGAFEHKNLATAMHNFLRAQLAPLQVEEPWRIDFVDCDVAPEILATLDWSLSIREDSRQGEQWFVTSPADSTCDGPESASAEPPLEREPIAARTTEDLKEKLARTIARELLLALNPP